MALVHAHFFSKALGMERAIEVVLPQIANGIGQGGAKEPLERHTVPVMYLLHGASDDQTIWQRRTSIERYALEKGLAVVMASTDLGFYCDAKYGYDYFRYFSQELPDTIPQFFPMISTKREDTFAAGLSMGGFGAFKLGILCSERFSHVASLSGLLDPVAAVQSGMGEFLYNSMGSLEEVQESVNDLPFQLEKKIKDKAELPRFFACCGTEDFLYNINVSFRDRFAAKIDYTYYEEPGTHEWGFWDRNIRRVIDWLPLAKEVK